MSGETGVAAIAADASSARGPRDIRETTRWRSDSDVMMYLAERRLPKERGTQRITLPLEHPHTEARAEREARGGGASAA